MISLECVNSHNVLFGVNLEYLSNYLPIDLTVTAELFHCIRVGTLIYQFSHQILPNTSTRECSHHYNAHGAADRFILQLYLYRCWIENVTDK